MLSRRYKAKTPNEKAIAELKGLAAAPNVDWVQQLERGTRDVVEAMTAIHGGKWNVVVNHRVCLVTIAREFDPI